MWTSKETLRAWLAEPPPQNPARYQPPPESNRLKGSIMSFVKGVQCRECGENYPKKPLHVCETCLGPLEIVYDYDGIRNTISREKIAARERNLWRYREL